MSKYYIKIDPERCISCHACEVHCKVKNNVPAGAFLGKLITLGPIKKGVNPKILNMFMPCFHCEQPWCVAACPTGAMVRREKDGIVYVNRDLCVGCKACIIACPWAIPQWNEYDGKVMKCDFCMDRLDQGLEPACVTGCATHALRFVKANEISAETRENYGRSVLKHQIKTP